MSACFEGRLYAEKMIVEENTLGRSLQGQPTRIRYRWEPPLMQMELTEQDAGPIPDQQL